MDRPTEALTSQADELERLPLIGDAAGEIKDLTRMLSEYVEQWMPPEHHAPARMLLKRIEDLSVHIELGASKGRDLYDLRCLFAFPGKEP